MRKLYWFYYHGELVASVFAENDEEARNKAIEQAIIFCDRPYENPGERMAKIRMAEIRFFE